MGTLALALVAAVAALVSVGDAAIVEHVFRVGNIMIKHLCKDTIITVVNKQFPGPSIEITDGDTVVVHVINESPHDATIHWHGIKQHLSCWTDGVGMITQCPIRPKSNFTYQFNVTAQEGTLWWHGHTSYLRATVHGALIIRPKGGDSAYPFPKPDEEIPIIIGDWWTTDVFQVEKNVLNGGFEDFPKAFTINGMLGDLYNCSGQTIDALMVADAPPGQYYMVAKSNQSPLPNTQIPNYITRGLVRYKLAPSSANQIIMPQMPDIHDFLTSFRFHNSFTSLVHPSQPSVPLHVDEHLFVTISINTVCKHNNKPCKISERITVASMNNISFQLPTTLSLLEAHFNKVEGVYTQDFPIKPPKFFNFTDRALNYNNPKEDALELTSKGTKVKKVKYNSVVEVILQATAIATSESHPIHLHGFNFFVLAQGFGNYDAKKAILTYNLVDPPMRNTLAVPLNGWATIRFVADNPGMWLMHCHFEYHLPMGMATAFEVENGLTEDTILPPPPAGFPKCPYHDVTESDTADIGYELK